MTSNEMNEMNEMKSSEENAIISSSIPTEILCGGNLDKIMYMMIQSNANNQQALLTQHRLLTSEMTLHYNETRALFTEAAKTCHRLESGQLRLEHNQIILSERVDKLVCRQSIPNVHNLDKCYKTRFLLLFIRALGFNTRTGTFMARAFMIKNESFVIIHYATLAMVLRTCYPNGLSMFGRIVTSEMRESLISCSSGGAMCKDMLIKLLPLKTKTINLQQSCMLCRVEDFAQMANYCYTTYPNDLKLPECEPDWYHELSSGRPPVTTVMVCKETPAFLAPAWSELLGGALNELYSHLYPDETICYIDEDKSKGIDYNFKTHFGLNMRIFDDPVLTFEQVRDIAIDWMPEPRTKSSTISNNTNNTNDSIGSKRKRETRSKTRSQSQQKIKRTSSKKQLQIKF